MKYEAMNQAIIKGVGGPGNVKSVVHCATRLRFVLNDESKADDDAVKNIPGILQLVKKAGQYQLVIGNNVEDVYNELADMLDLDNQATTADSGKDNRNLFDKVIGTITGSIAPVIPLLAGAGMGKVLLLILTLTGALSDKSQTYQMLNLIFDTGYFFMPAFIGFSAAKIFKTNQYLGAFMGLVTVNPNWTALVAAAKPVSFIGIPVQLVSYSSTLITAILAVWIMSYIEKFVKKITPGMIKVFAEPMLIMLITAPLTFIVLGPIANLISMGIAAVSMFLYEHAGFIAIPLLAAAYPWLVSIGIHKALSPISIQLVATQGFDPIIRVVALCSNMSQAAASLAVGLKTKNKQLRALALSSTVTAYLGGITEPAMFGVNLKLKKPMYGAMIGGAIAGLFAGFMKMKAFIYVTPGLLSLPMWVSKTENFVVLAIATIVIASIATFVATWLIGFDDPVSDETTKKEQAEADKVVTTKHTINSPVVGETRKLSEVNDETFASGVMGNGIAVIPSEGLVVAPADGIASAVFDTSHAIGIHLDNDADLLIHVGIDTVELHGKYFETLVKKGERFHEGQPLLKFDLEKIKAAGYDPTVMIIVLNTKDFLEVLPVPESNQSVKVGNNLLMLA
ncbi:PTS beta-glucoside transporter subunit IIABC [Loigolactobacillus coryniformis subsp. coryniformis]|uniref:PTS system sucrose-specific EIIBCA component n=1 Tax=Loigolactobacillus coryniformis subsp. coryniformis KCTC 3167 = DSM 20001 TaxID=913848 RepID=A0A0R1F4N2_9LACO|nr:PTS beta-glucoside transporter subunit IIBCA [Loigolactobacillus coryniformis]ATO56546.1 PTS beta-glucoside transporter subunit EIIBCA [Loigolactobacillus coryniformis subsp. coryniformis KCTC 3167 = DSM 20001]KRK14010.1 beta-glucosides PTS, EIIBCA [Loigolactobacillus coryniformis subsp. coryniformis KCTC 3167 = DSM 20001]OEH90284.1 PTS beta-glucoside transporter subunit IIABC [Loigolactobacillus coryniformis subsp. coryniformis]